jgi:hypothetical protein
MEVNELAASITYLAGHGIAIGHEPAPDVALVIITDRVAELTAALELYKEANERLKVERDELAAHCESALLVFNAIDNDGQWSPCGNYWQPSSVALNKIDELKASTPAHSLAEHDAKVIEGFMDAVLRKMEVEWAIGSDLSRMPSTEAMTSQKFVRDFLSVAKEVQHDNANTLRKQAKEIGHDT